MVKVLAILMRSFSWLTLRGFGLKLLLTEENLDKGNSEMAFAHAFIPHSAIFPAIKDQPTQIEGEQSAKQLESLLTDLP